MGPEILRADMEDTVGWLDAITGVERLKGGGQKCGRRNLLPRYSRKAISAIVITTG